MSGAITSLPLYAFMASTRANLPVAFVVTLKTF
jgi:hypothetical protein